LSNPHHSEFDGRDAIHVIEHSAITELESQLKLAVEAFDIILNEVGTSTLTHKLARETDIYQLFLDNMGSRKFTPIKGLSEDAVKQFQDESIDVVFIDMCHLYECVKEDLQLWYPKVKYNGYIAGHDWSWPGVKEALFEIFPGHLRADGDCWLIQKTSGVYHGT
jgi:hypothetical protein